VPFPTGTQIAFIQVGAGQTTFAAGPGVEILSKNSNKRISARYSPATLIKRDTNTWILIGDLTA
jgi:beta-lactamase superfamily II metal-dependent hydrolase